MTLTTDILMRKHSTLHMITLFLTFSLLTSCSSEPEPVRVPPISDSSQSEVTALSSVTLDKELAEISGLDIWGEHNLIAIHDEAAKLYILDAGTGQIRNVFAPFAEENRPDCEGVAVTSDHVFIVTSTGQFFCAEITGDTLSPVYASKYIGLRDDVNFEGLCFDTTTNQLAVIAKAPAPFELAEEAKEKDKKSGKKKGKKKVAKQEFDEDTRIVYFLDVIGSELLLKDSLSLDVSELAKESREREFSPSGIDVDAAGNYTVIAARGRMIASFSRAGEVLSFAHLPKKTWPQPEGIVWLNSDSLAIASEGADAKPVLSIVEMP